MDKLPRSNSYDCREYSLFKDSNLRNRTEKTTAIVGDSRNRVKGTIAGERCTSGRHSEGTSGFFDNRQARDLGMLGSSFGGVVFRDSNLPENRKTCRGQDVEVVQTCAKRDVEKTQCADTTGEHDSPGVRDATHHNMLSCSIDPPELCNPDTLNHTQLTSWLHCRESCECLSKQYDLMSKLNHGLNPENSNCKCNGNEILNCAVSNFKCRQFEDDIVSELRQLDNCNAVRSQKEYTCVRRFSMGDEGFVRDSKLVNSGRNSIDSSASDNVFYGVRSALNSSSLSDVTSVSSSTTSLFSTRDTTTSRMRFELRHGRHNHDNEVVDYQTPLQRKDKEVKSLLKEKCQLLREKEEKDSEISSLKYSLETIKAEMEREKEKEVTELMEKFRVSEREIFEQTEKLCTVQVELATLDGKFIELKRQMSEKDEKFEENLLNMYTKGKMAALFEREEELEMLASSHKSPVTVRELTRKLSRTEMELAKWQGLRLEESYSHTDVPSTHADATLSFLKDAFFHFLTDRSGNEDHLRAIIKIFKYSETQMAKIVKGLEDFKHLDKKRLSLK